MTILDPIDGVPDPTVDRKISEILYVGGQCQTGSLPVLSAREMHLIVAEDALALADTVAFAAALNQARASESLTDWTAASGIDARDMLIHERQTRLYMTGRRLADMYRFGLQSDTWAPDSGATTMPGTLYPIPQSEIDVNCYLNGTCG